jgi:hypothetical protein
MFFTVNEKNHLLKSIASITAMRTDNVIVDDRIVPIGWLKENGIDVRVSCELSAFKNDGTIAKAGEAFYNAIHFTSEYGLDETRTIRLNYGRHWDQLTVYNEILCLLDLNQRKRDEWECENQKRIEAQRLHDERMNKRDQLIELFFSQHGKPASSYRIGQIVATRDGLVWKIASKHNDVELIPHGGDSLKVRVVPNDVLLIPGSKEYRDKFRYELHSISY